jgi:hypothetical protein
MIGLRRIVQMRRRGRQRVEREAIDGIHDEFEER